MNEPIEELKRKYAEMLNEVERDEKKLAKKKEKLVKYTTAMEVLEEFTDTSLAPKALPGDEKATDEIESLLATEARAMKPGEIIHLFAKRRGAKVAEISRLAYNTMNHLKKNKRVVMIKPTDKNVKGNFYALPMWLQDGELKKEYSGKS